VDITPLASERWIDFGADSLSFSYMTPSNKKADPTEIDVTLEEVHFHEISSIKGARPFFFICFSAC
jgi:hypothetical protein